MVKLFVVTSWTVPKLAMGSERSARAYCLTMNRLDDSSTAPVDDVLGDALRGVGSAFDLARYTYQEVGVVNLAADVADGDDVAVVRNSGVLVAACVDAEHAFEWARECSNGGLYSVHVVAYHETPKSLSSVATYGPISNDRLTEQVHDDDDGGGGGLRNRMQWPCTTSTRSRWTPRRMHGTPQTRCPWEGPRSPLETLRRPRTTSEPLSALPGPQSASGPAETPSRPEGLPVDEVQHE